LADFIPDGVPTHWLTKNGVKQKVAGNIPRTLVVGNMVHESGYYAPYHSHERGQLLFISEGLIQVSAKNEGFWVVPPLRAVWLPPQIEHDARVINAVKMCNVYVSAEESKKLPTQCQVITVTPLLREIILEIAKFETLYNEAGEEGRLVSVFLDQLKTTPKMPLHLPYPSSEALQKVAKALVKNPADARSIERWSDDYGLSSRTFSRRFLKETGMNFGLWRQQARLLAALTRIAQGDAISHISHDLGYDSQSAFIAMFRKAMGKTPGRYFSNIST
jgi:AraC-like DNA-binding protein